MLSLSILQSLCALHTEVLSFDKNLKAILLSTKAGAEFHPLIFLQVKLQQQQQQVFYFSSFLHHQECQKFYDQIINRNCKHNWRQTNRQSRRSAEVWSQPIEGRHSSVDSSAPTTLRPRVRIPNTPFIVKFCALFVIVLKKDENKQKEAGLAHFIK